MPVNFGAQSTEAPEVPSFVTPQQGVGKDVSYLDSAARMFGQAEDLVKNFNEKRDASSVAEFTRQQLLVAEGVSQGKYSSTYARTLMRRNLVGAIEASPSLSSDFVKAQSGILGIAGGAQIVDEGTEEEQRISARRSQLISDGLLAPDATDEEYQKAESYSRQATEAQRRYEETTRTIDLELKQLNLSQERRNELDAQRKAESQRYLADLAPAQFQGMKTQLQQIVDGGGTEAEKVQAIEDMFLAFRSQTTSIVGNLSTHESSAMLAPFDLLRQQYIDRATGKLSDEELTRGIERTLSLQTKIALADPAVAKVAVASKLFGQGALQQLAVYNQEAMNAAFNYMSNNGPNGDVPETPFVTESNKSTALEGYLDNVVSSLSSDDESTRQEAVVHMNSVLESAEVYEGMLRRDPKSGMKMVNFFATAGFLKARNSGELSDEALQGAADVIQRNYADEVWGLVRRQFREDKVIPEHLIDNTQGEDLGRATAGMRFSPEQQQATPDAVKAVMDVNGVAFRAADPANALAVKKARELNRNLKPAINNTIKALAHLEGRSDYGAMWNEMSEQFLNPDMVGGGGQEKVPGGDAGDDLTIQDFQATPGISPEAEPLLNLLDRTETGGTADYDTLLGFSQNSQFEGTKVSQMTVDEVIDFQTSDEYRQFSKEQVGRVATPVGRFQIVGTTLKGLKKELGLSGDEMFNEEMQNRLFNALLGRRLRAAGGDVDKAMSQVRKEWEGFKNVSDDELRSALENLV